MGIYMFNKANSLHIIIKLALLFLRKQTVAIENKWFVGKSMCCLENHVSLSVTSALLRTNIAEGTNQF